MFILNHGLTKLLKLFYVLLDVLSWKQNMKKIETDSSLYPFYQLFSRWIWVSRYQKSLFWILLELRVMEVVVTTGAIRRAKLQSSRHHQQTNTQFFTGRMLPDAQPTVSKYWRKKLKLTATQKKYTGCVKSSRPTLTLPFRQRWIDFMIFFTVKSRKDLQTTGI